MGSIFLYTIKEHKKITFIPQLLKVSSKCYQTTMLIKLSIQDYLVLDISDKYLLKENIHTYYYMCLKTLQWDATQGYIFRLKRNCLEDLKNCNSQYNNN